MPRQHTSVPQRLRPPLVTCPLPTAPLPAPPASGLARTASSLALFLALVAIVFWLPGTVLLDFARVRARGLDAAALSLVSGTAAAAAAYWLAARVGAR